MLWALVVLLLLLWIGGFSLQIAGGLIHLLLLFAVISLVRFSAPLSTSWCAK